MQYGRSETIFNSPVNVGYTPPGCALNRFPNLLSIINSESVILNHAESSCHRIPRLKDVYIHFVKTNQEVSDVLRHQESDRSLLSVCFFDLDNQRRTIYAIPAPNNVSSNNQ